MPHRSVARCAFAGWSAGRVASWVGRGAALGKSGEGAKLQRECIAVLRTLPRKERRMAESDRQRTVVISGASGRTGPTVLRTFLAAGYGVAAIGRDTSRLAGVVDQLRGGERA